MTIRIDIRFEWESATNMVLDCFMYFLLLISYAFLRALHGPQILVRLFDVTNYSRHACKLQY